MKLTLKDRIILPNIFPKEGKFETLIIIADIQKKITITQEEIEKYEISSEGSSIKWNEKGVKAEFEIDISESEKNALGDILKKLSDESKLSVDFVEYYKMFAK